MLLSDADREQLFERLNRHAAAGTFEIDELERRVEAIAAARDQRAGRRGYRRPAAAARTTRDRRAPAGAAATATPTSRGADWRPTGERFRDPRTNRVMRVWEDAAGPGTTSRTSSSNRRRCATASWRRTAAEEPQEEQEDVEDVEEDRRRDRDRAVGLSARRRRLKSKIVKPPKITSPSDRVDEVAAGDRDEDRDEPEHDQRQQRPEQDPAHDERSRRVA